MWNSSPSSSTVSLSDKKQNNRKRVEVLIDDSKCNCGDFEQQLQQEKINDSEVQTSTLFAGLEPAADKDNNFLELAGETIDSESESVAGACGGHDSEKLSTSESITEKQQHSPSNLDSNTLEEEFDDSDCDLQEKEKAEATIAKLLLLPWKRFFKPSYDGNAYIHWACISGNVNIIAEIIRMSPNPCLLNIKNFGAYTPLHLATLNSQLKIIRMLLIAGADPTVPDRYGNTALHIACLFGDEQCVRALIIPISVSEINEVYRQCRRRPTSYFNCAHLPLGLEFPNYSGKRCVHLAAKASFINILRILVFYGADINAGEKKSGLTPLHIAIKYCNENLLNYLLFDCQKLNLEAATYTGLTAYQMACICNNSKMKYLLEKRGAQPLTPPDSDCYCCDMEDSDCDCSEIESDLDN